MKNVKFLNILAVYNSSIFQDFESFRRTNFDIFEDDIRLVLDEYISNLITYEKLSGIHTFNGLLEAVFLILQPEYEVFNISVDFEVDDISMKTKLVVRPSI